MQALVSEELQGSLFGFEGADKAPTLWRERKQEVDIKVRLGRKLSLHTFFLERKYAPLAQLVEQLTLNQWVPGSNP